MILRFREEDYALKRGRAELMRIRRRMRNKTYLEGTDFLYKGYHIAERIYTGKDKSFPDSWFIMDKRYFTLKRISEITKLGYYELSKLFKSGVLPPPTCLAWAFDANSRKYKLIRLFSNYKITVIRETLQSYGTVEELYYGQRKKSGCK